MADEAKNVVTINGEEFSRDTMSDQQNYDITKSLIDSVSEGSGKEEDTAFG